MLRKFIFLTIIIFLIGCSREDNASDQIQETGLEGTWYLQNLKTGSKLTFWDNNFTIQSGTVTINGTFHISNNQFNGKALSRSGANNNALQPNDFTGNFQISNGNRVTFTNFSGNWNAVFSSWYGKQ